MGCRTSSSYQVVLQLKHFQSMPLWRRVQVPTSIRLSNQLSKDLRTNMFGPRRFHMDSCLDRRHLWQHPQQLICPGRALHVPKALQQSTCQHHLRLRRCPPVLQQLFKSRMWPRMAITGRSVTDIDWGSRPLHEQLEPNLKGGPRSSRTPADLSMLRAKTPKLTKHLFDGLFPADNTITAVQKNHGVHKIHMSEVAAWVLNATHWFSLLQQPMTVIVWCHNWEDASKFQYLMQILQVHYDDYVPRYQIFMLDDSKIYGSIQQWQKPTTIWDGKPVLGFMAETFLDDLPVIGFKDFNPMWTFPTTSVNQCWEPMTFGMAPWHICENVDKQKSKEALQSQSPIAAFKACNMIQALGIAYSKIVLPSSDSKGESKGRTYCPTTWTHCRPGEP